MPACFLWVLLYAAHLVAGQDWERRQFHECSQSHMTSQLNSRHSNEHEDRIYQFQCRSDYNMEFIQIYVKNNIFFAILNKTAL